MRGGSGGKNPPENPPKPLSEAIQGGSEAEKEAGGGVFGHRGGKHVPPVSCRILRDERHRGEYFSLFRKNFFIFLKPSKIFEKFFKK